MSVVDRVLQSLIRYLQKKQKIRTKKKTKRAFSKVPRKTIKSKSVPKRAVGVKREMAYSKVRAIKRQVKKPVGKTSVLRRGTKKKIPNKKALVIKKSIAQLKERAGNVSYAGGGGGKLIKGQKPSADALIGDVTHFFSRIQVVVLKMTKGSLRVNQKVRVWGKGTDFVQKVGSLQIESVDVQTAHKGQLVGLKVDKPVNVGSKVYLMG
jgi:hypothetical protein